MKMSAMASVLVMAMAVAMCMPACSGIGVNYGGMANDLPPPTVVAQWLKTSTIIDKVKIFDADSSVIGAFANTGIQMIISAPIEDIPCLPNPRFADDWVAKNVRPFVPATQIQAIAIGNEVILTGNDTLISNLVPAIQGLHGALARAGLDKTVKVSTPHALTFLSVSSPPSAGRFRRGPLLRQVIKPLLRFLRSTQAPFMINPYTYFAYNAQSLDYAIFRPNPGSFDPNTGITYTNMYTSMLDALYSALKALKFNDVPIMVTETGWPSVGDPGQVGVSLHDAMSYNYNLVKMYLSGTGTPLMPNTTIDTFIFSLFNENLKPGPVAERNFGLFYPNMTPVYNAGVLKQENGQPLGKPIGHGAVPSKKRWCVPTRHADVKVLQNNIDYVCGHGGVDCTPIQPGGACFDPNTVADHASYAMNAYFQHTGQRPDACVFADTGRITHKDPSHGGCLYQV